MRTAILKKLAFAATVTESKAVQKARVHQIIFSAELQADIATCITEIGHMLTSVFLL